LRNFEAFSMARQRFGVRAPPRRFGWPIRTMQKYNETNWQKDN
jgi:hypothetical protein